MKPRSLRGFGLARGGATAVEFALVIGPFLLLMFGVIEFGRLMWTRQALQQAAMAGARCAGVLNSSCASSGAFSSANTVTYVQGLSSGWGITLTTSNITATNSTTCAGVSGFSQVAISYTFQTPVAVLIGLPSAGYPLTVSACFPNQS